MMRAREWSAAVRAQTSGARRGLSFRLLGLALVLGTAFGAAAADFDDDRRLAPLERWERMSVERREEVRHRFERFRELSVDEQRELAERARNLSRARQRILGRLSPDERRQLAALPPERRELILNELLEEELKAHGRRLHALLPEHLRARFEAARPQERLRYFTEFKLRQRERASMIALDKLGRRLGYEQDEIRILQQLPDQQRLQKALELRKLLQERSVEEHGLPVGLTPDKWVAMLALDPEDFFDEVLFLRESGGWRRGESAADDPTARLREAVFEIQGELRPRVAELLELADLSAEERRFERERRQRERIARVLRERQALDAKALDALEAAPKGEFYRRVRELVREAGTHD